MLPKKRIKAISFFMKVAAIEQKLEQLARLRERAPVPHSIDDPRLEEVRCKTERKVFERFMENYSRAQEFEVVSESNSTMLVRSLRNDSAYLVVAHECECREQQRTGVGCPHLIQVAITDSSRSYLRLIDKRWWVDEPPTISVDD